MRSRSAIRFGAAAVAAGLSVLALAGCGEVFGRPGDTPAGPGAAASLPPADPAAMRAFLETNGKAPGVRTTASGLQYKVVTAGPAGGASPGSGDMVKVNYKGSLIDGTPFDASEPEAPSDFQVGDLVDGFNEALTLMRPGDKWMVYIPAALGYGDQQRGPIPAGSVLVFEIELVGVLPQAGPEAMG